ncbi:hypothetical protein RIF24_06710 [Exiguobacterium acetylicum]|uniref:hypothetical protein n=1 Tax=Exiguobacterium acetylicum TaxID=41170 RepID=UPI003977D011
MKTIYKQKKIIGALIFSLSIPIVALTLLSFIFYGDLFKLIPFISDNRNKIKLSTEVYPTLSEAINYTISGYSIIITGIFSYALLKTSIKSYEIAESIKSLESNRDRESVRQSALIVYYELLTGFSNIKDLYTSIVLNDSSPNPKRLFLSDDWVKNISLLKDKLNEYEINEIFKIYSRFLTIKSILESYDEPETNNTGNSHYEKIRHDLINEIENSFLSFIPKGVLNNDFGNVEKLLKREYYLLLQKIKIATYDIQKIKRCNIDGLETLFVNETKLYEGEFLDNEFNGKGTLYTFAGLEKYKGDFLKGKFISGVSKEYYEDDENKIMYEVIYEKNKKIQGLLNKVEGDMLVEKNYINGSFDGDIIYTGDTIQYDDKHKIVYVGQLLNGKFDGEGKYFIKGKIKYEGTFKNDLIIKGNEFKNGKLYFKGDFKNEMAYNGQIKNYSNSYVEQFNGILKEGKPYTGKGYIYQNDSSGWDRDWLLNSYHYEEQEIENYDIEYYESMEEDYAEQQNNYIRETYSTWQNYIKANWENGSFEEQENLETNIKVFYQEISKK